MMKVTKMTVEEVRDISIGSLHKLLVSLEENETIRIKYPKYDESIFIIDKDGNNQFSIKDKDSNQLQVFHLAFTPTGFGERPWFVCPSCQNRCGKLYVIERMFACRKCHDLTYTTSQISGVRLNELDWKIRRLQARLGMNVSAHWSSPDYVTPEDLPLFKPKYMKQHTWWLLRTNLEVMQIHRLEAWVKSCR